MLHAIHSLFSRLPLAWRLTFLVAVLASASGLEAQSFCGRTLSEWTQVGANIIDLRNSSCGQTINGTSNRDVILGTECVDRIHGRGGADCIYGFGDDDRLWGDGGDDEIHGGQGEDVIFGDVGRDALFGDEGNDEIHGDNGRDTLHGGTGDDRIWGDSGRDELHGGFGRDQLVGDAGRDEIFGGPGDDRLQGDAGRDLLCGQGASDRLVGNSSRDRLDGGLGSADSCDGGGSQDRCYRCESSSSCAEQSGSVCPDDPPALTGIADPGCTVCARQSNGTLFCSTADSAGNFVITRGEVPPSTTEAGLPASGSVEVFCIGCHGDGVNAEIADGAPLDVRCVPCAGTELQAGTCNLFQACTDGNPSEDALPSSDLYQFITQNTIVNTPNNQRPPLDFDEIPGVGATPRDSHFGHTFQGIPQGVCAATLSATLQSAPSGNTGNDSLGLEITGPGGPFVWSGGLAGLTATNWGNGSLATVNLDLDNLPPNGQSLLHDLDDGSLDVFLQDDTGIDCLKLCFRTQCSDLSLDKELTGGSLGEEPQWQFTLTVENEGAVATAGAITVTDQLPNGLAFVSGSGTGWTCTATGGVVTCAYDTVNFPPIPASGTSQITLVLKAADRDAFQDLENCATVSTGDDQDPANDQGCASLPCPDSSDPRVNFLEGSGSDPAVCAAAGPEVCSEDQTWFWGTCGCGCIDEDCPDPRDPRVDYLIEDPALCAIARLVCSPGRSSFSSPCGCGCLTPEECPLFDDPDVDYRSQDPETCSNVIFFCGFGSSSFTSPCGCGCRRNNIHFRLFGVGTSSSRHLIDGREDLRTEVDLATGFGIEIDAEFPVSSRLGIALSIASLRSEARTQLTGRSIASDESSGTTFQLGLGANFHFMIRQRFDLYVGPFLGLIDIEDPPTLDAETSLALGANLGFDIPLGSGRWGVAFNLRYLDADIDIEGRAGSPVKGSIDLERWSLGTGVSYRF